MSDKIHFKGAFRLLTGNHAFPWQEEMYKRMVKGDIPSSCNLPTGLGKTAVIPIWLIALANEPKKMPRRLVYVVNRRTVVDQATDEARGIRDQLKNTPHRPEILGRLADRLASLAAVPNGEPLAISTLRGQFADNGEWRSDPARPAIVVGTVDMIGSRLLFSGYGIGFKSKPLHAGFLGQDALLIHDEAHLEPAFQQLLVTIENEQRRVRDYRPLWVMSLSATPPESKAYDHQPPDHVGRGELLLGPEDRTHPIVRQRIRAKKGLVFHAVEDEKKETAERVAELALGYKDSGLAILIFLRRLDDVERVAEKLGKAKIQPEPILLTGTLRGKERDELVKQPIFRRFLSSAEKDETQIEGTAYLICTSAGEVGVNYSANHLVCDLTTFESMAQRWGRVNRFGCSEARIDVVHPKKVDQADEYEARRQKTLALLTSLPERGGKLNASPAALLDLPVSERLAAYSPAPVIRSTTGILFDAWSLTSINRPLVSDPLPGQPPVAEWLHGIIGSEPPETHVAWREEVDVIHELLDRYPPETLLDDYPLKPHELLRDRTDRVIKELTKLAQGQEGKNVWVIDQRGQVLPTTLGELTKGDKGSLNGATVLLSPMTGGLNNGMLDGSASFDERHRYDVADEWLDADESPRRRRVWDDEPVEKGLRWIREIDTVPDAEERDHEEGESSVRRFWRWYVRPGSADDDGSRSAETEQLLDDHGNSAQGYASRIVSALGIADTSEGNAVVLAARWHDLGKDRNVWQRAVGNHEYPNKQALAKSGRRRAPLDLNDYRHEFGSLVDLSHGRRNSSPATEFGEQSEEVRDLVLHLIAAHHGRARPHFPAKEAFDPVANDVHTAELASKVPWRFARLQRRYGRWGLAYLESLVRSADILASMSRGGSK